jgi:hypothetical protein
LGEGRAILGELLGEGVPIAAKLPRPDLLCRRLTIGLLTILGKKVLGSKVLGSKVLGSRRRFVFCLFRGENLKKRGR